MSADHDPAAYKDVMVVLATAAIAVPLLQRLHVSPVLGYLLAGVVLGPHLLGAWAGHYPLLSWVSVSNAENLSTLGEFGVAFLLFVIGLELSPRRLWTMRRLVFGLGSLQIVLSGLVLAGGALAFGHPANAAVIIGFSLAMSSTAIVIDLLARQDRLSLGTGRTSFAILLMQDLAVVPLLLLVPALGLADQASLLFGIGKAFGHAMLAIGVIIAVGQIVLRPLFRLVASTDSVDLFVAAVLLVAAGSAIASDMAGLSMALGAFTAGLLLAETEYRKAIETTIDPFKGLLLGAFFFTVGAGLDLGAVIGQPYALAAGVAGLIAIKGAIVYGLIRAFGFNRIVAGRTAALVAPGGEFAFIVLALAASGGIVPNPTAAYFLAVTSLSMALIPILDALARRTFPIPAAVATDPALQILPSAEEQVDAIVIGHGRVGALVSDMLARHGVHHVITEKRPDLVGHARTENKPIYYGDALNIEFLRHCGLDRARAVIITIHDWDATDELVSTIHAARPGVVIVARARDADHARRLYERGASDAVPETIEASLQLSEAALVDLGVPTGPVIASIHERRDEFRKALQTAAGRMGRTETRGVRAARSRKEPTA